LINIKIKYFILKIIINVKILEVVENENIEKSETA